MEQNSLELDVYKYGQLIFDKGNSVEKTVYSANDPCTNGYSYAKNN